MKKISSERWFWLFFTLFCLYFAALGIPDGRICADAHNNGKLVKAIVKYTPTSCASKSFHIYVIYRDKSYKVFASGAECLQGYYQQGNEVSLVYSEKYDDLRYPNENCYIQSYLPTAVFFIVAIISCILFVRKKNDDADASE